MVLTNHGNSRNNKKANELMQATVITLTGSVNKELHKDITCKELFGEMHQMTSIPEGLLRITMGSQELYPK